MTEPAVPGVADGSHWDAICVGTGICSLAFAAQLTKFRPGTRVLLIDKHSRPGGYATNFERPKQAARLDCSLHKLSGMGGEGNLRRILGGLGADEALSFIHPDHYFAAILPDRRIVLPNEAAATEAVLAEAFPTEREGLAQFFQDAASHGKDGYFQYQMLSGDYRPDMKALRAAHRTLKRVTVAEKLDGLFSSSELKNILAAPAVYVGAFPEEISYLYYLHVVYATLHAGNAYVLGSAQRLSDHLVERIVSAGGGISLSNPVRRVLSDGAGRATGVETLKGRYFSDRIFLNAAPHYALDHLFAADEALVPVRAKLEKLKPSNSTTTVYFFMDGQSADYGLPCSENMVFGSGFAEGIALRAGQGGQAMSPAGGAAMEHAFWQAGPMEVTGYQMLDADGGAVVVANVLDRIEHWPARRDPEYKRKKTRARAALEARVAAAFPGFAAHVRAVELATPRTYQRFTNNTDGAGYGALVGTDLSGHGFHYGFPVKGVQFLSSWVAGPGYEAAFSYGEMLARTW